MNKIQRFEDLQAWQSARELTKAVHQVGRTPPLAKETALRDKLLNAATTAMSLTAEGFDRFDRQEKLEAWAAARGACSEFRSLTYICEDNGTGDLECIRSLREKCDRTTRLLYGLSRSLHTNRETAPPAGSYSVNRSAH